MYVRGKFIVFEGVDGAGLSTQAMLLEKHLKERGLNVILTKEPTNGLIGGLIKAGLKREWRTTSDAMQLLFSADRAHHLQTEILPALKEGKVVISDRYLLSTLAYGMLELDYEWLKNINSKFLIPNLTFILDADPVVCLKRLNKSRFGFELFEETAKLRRVRQNFLKLSKEYENCWVLDASSSINEIHQRVREIIDRKLESEWRKPTS